jgi:hypothetical protein
MQPFLPLFFLALWTTTATATTLGLDVSQAHDQATWKCLRAKTNRTWGIVRAYHSYGKFDTTATATLAAAKSAGFDTMDVYMFPCPTKSASSQAQDMVHQLQSSSWSSVWIDVETNPSTGCGWSATDFSSNCQFVQELITAFTGTGTAVGIYSSKYEWTAVMGSDCTVGSHLPLWYAHYDTSGATCSDYPRETFGGWTRPYAKQYADHGVNATASCGFQNADMNVKC